MSYWLLYLLATLDDRTWLVSELNKRIWQQGWKCCWHWIKDWWNKYGKIFLKSFIVFDQLKLLELCKINISCPEIFSLICHWDPILLMTLWFMAQNRAIIQNHKNWVTWSELYIVPAFLVIKMWNITPKKCAVFPIHPGVFPFCTII